MQDVMNKVRSILTRYDKTRNSDRLLLYVFYKDYYSDLANKDIDQMRVKDFLLDADAPSFESIRRCRQKVQEQNENLRADSDIRDKRALKQKEICEWALNSRR